MIIRLESVQESPNIEVKAVMDDVVDTFKDNNIEIDYVNPDNKTIYVLSDESLDDANYILRTVYPDARKLGVRVAKNFKQTKTIDVINPIKSEINEALTGSVPTIQKLNTNVDKMVEFILRDLMGMRNVYSDNTTATYIGYLRSGDFVVAFVEPYRDTAQFLVFTDISDDATDDIITLCSEGVDINDAFFDDYNPNTFSFWEFVSEQLY